MIWIILSHILVFAESFLFIEFVTRYNGIDWTRRINKQALAFTLVLSFIVTILTNATLENLQARLLIRTAIVLIYCLYFLEGSQIGKLLSCLFFPSVLMIAYGAFGILLSAISTRITLHQVWYETGFAHVLFQALLLLILFYVTRVFLRFRGSYRHPYRKIHIILAVTIPLITLIFSSILVELLEKQVLNVGMLILMVLGLAGTVIIDIVIYYLLSSIGEEGDLVMENEMLRRYLQYEQRNMDEQKRTYDQIRSLRHELKNYLAALEYKIDSGQLEDAKQFIEDYRGRIQRFSNQVQTPNETLNFILNTQLSQAAMHQASTKVVIEESSIPMKDIDLHSLLGNLFNNAIEALEKIPEDKRDLQVEIRPKGGYISILVKNRILESVLEKNPHLITSKEDVSQHGFGVKIIRSLAEKYQGYADFYESDSYFCAQVLIPQRIDPEREEE